MNAAELSRQLRTGQAPMLARRRKIVGLSLVSITSMSIIALYQMGIIKHLPEPSIPYLDADKVDASAEAYSYFATPDAVLGMVSYGVTAALTAMGGADRAREQPWIVLALAAKVAVDAVGAGKLTVDQWTKHRAFCSYCLIAATATFATVPLVIPEARVAYRELSNR